MGAGCALTIHCWQAEGSHHHCNPAQSVSIQVRRYHSLSKPRKTLFCQKFSASHNMWWCSTRQQRRYWLCRSTGTACATGAPTEERICFFTAVPRGTHTQLSSSPVGSGVTTFHPVHISVIALESRQEFQQTNQMKSRTQT